MDASTKIKKNPIFKSIPDEACSEVEKRVDQKILSRGEVLFEKGDPGDYVYSITDGLLKISMPDETSNREKTLAILGAGEIVGEMATLGNQVRSGRAIAIRKTTLIQIHEDEFLKMLTDFPEIGLNVIRELSKRLLMFDEEIQTVTFQTIPGRLANQLIRLANKFGTEAENGVKIDIRLTHQQLGDMVGTNRETITRFLNKFKKEGSIQIENNEILILDYKKLEGWM